MGARKVGETFLRTEALELSPGGKLAVNNRVVWSGENSPGRLYHVIRERETYKPTEHSKKHRQFYVSKVWY